jgi:hypothetical protein
MNLALVPGKFEGLPPVRQISVMLSLVHLTIVEDCSGEAAALLLPVTSVLIERCPIFN